MKIKIFITVFLMLGVCSLAVAEVDRDKMLSHLSDIKLQKAELKEKHVSDRQELYQYRDRKLEEIELLLDDEEKKMAKKDLFREVNMKQSKLSADYKTKLRKYQQQEYNVRRGRDPDQGPDPNSPEVRRARQRARLQNKKARDSLQERFRKADEAAERASRGRTIIAPYKASPKTEESTEPVYSEDSGVSIFQKAYDDRKVREDAARKEKRKSGRVFQPLSGISAEERSGKSSGGQSSSSGGAVTQNNPFDNAIREGYKGSLK